MQVPTVLLTQPAARAVMLAQTLADHGLPSLSWPLTAALPVPGLDWQALHTTLCASVWALFASPAALDVVFSGLQSQALSWPRTASVGLVGAGSREAFETWRHRLAGLAEVRVLSPQGARQDALALLDEPEMHEVRALEIVVLRRADGSEAWLDRLQERGARLHALPVYLVTALCPPAQASDWLCAHAHRHDAVVLSVAGVDVAQRLTTYVRALPCAQWVLRCPVYTQHVRIAEALAQLGWSTVVQHAPGARALVDAIHCRRTP